LKKDVGGVGTRDSVREVSDGYALNFLIPRALAEQATPEKVAALDSRKKKESAEHAEQAKQTADTLTRLNGARIVVEAKANEKGRLFKGINKKDVAEKIADTYQGVGPDMVELDDPIVEVGEYAVRLTKDGAEAVIQFVVEAMN
jgi:large subunit ribosomal protein L9